MKKLLSLALVFVLVLTMLTSCDILSNLFQPQAQYNLAGAAEYLDGLYKEDLSKTPVDYKVVAQVKIDDVVYTVEWTVDTDKVTVGAAENGLVNIDVDEKSAEEVKYVLTATIKAPDGTSTTKQYTVTVPKYEAMSWEDYIAAAAGDLISEVSGVVTGIVSKSEGSGYNCFFMQDATGGGYYIYGMTEDPIADLGIAVGMTVTVAGGVKDIYNGTHEIKPSEQGLKITIDSKEITPVTPMDYTEIFKNAADLKDIALVEKQSSLVTIKGVEISGQALDNGYLYFKLDGKEAYLRISSSTLGFPTANKEAFIAKHAEKRGYIADVTGIISVYSGAFYLVPVSVDAFAYGALAEKTPEQKAQEALDILEIPTVISKNTELVLPATSDVYEGVTFEWVCNSDNFAIVDGKVNVVLGAAADTLKLTATATCGDKTAVKEFTIEVSANVVLSTTKPYIPSLFQAKLDGGKTLYLDGTFGERYLNTTEDITKAVAVYAELAEGGYKFYILVDGAKNYVYLYKNDADKDSVKFDAANANVFSYNAAVNAWVTNFNNTEYYLGTYNTYNTVSCSRLSYINAENTGIEQFPLEYNIVAEGVALNGTLFQAKLDGGKTLYLDGTFGERYLNTTEDITKAVAIYAEKAEDGYKFYILVDGAKNYVYLYKNDADKSAVKFDAENANVFKFDGATNAWVTVYDGGDYYLGTYNTYNTVSSSKTSYINAENTGVEQFPLNYIIATGTAVEPPVGGDDPVDPPVDETPDLSTTKGIYEAASKLDNNVNLDGTFTMTGVITAVNEAFNSQYNNVTVTIIVDGYTFKCYRIKGTGADVIAVGDTITVTGSITAWYGEPQFATGSSLDSYTKAPTTGGETNETKESLNIFAATGTLAADSESIAWSFTNFSATSYKNGAELAIRNSDPDHYRFYAGHKLNISAKNGETIEKVVITATASKYVENLVTSLTEAGYTVVADGVTITATGINASSFEFVNTTTSQIRFSTFVVYYK